MSADPLSRYCSYCREETRHGVSYLAAEDLNELACLACGTTQYAAAHVHWLYQGRLTACGLGIGGVSEAWGYLDRRFARAAAEVTCPDCALMMIEELSGPRVPDWRPEVAIAEDFYAA